MMNRKESFIKIMTDPEPEDTSTYSAYMRKLKKDNPESMEEFMRHYKEAFDAAMEEDLENHQNVALLKAKQESNAG